ncbi:hypothetical protein [Streptomyces decoyicus]
MEGGILLALGSIIPISPYVTTLAFVIYLGCRLVEARCTQRAPRTALGSPGAPVRTHT